MKVVCWIGSELRDLPRFGSTSPIDAFLAQMEILVLETQRIEAMDVVIKETVARWWAMHFIDIEEWVKVVE
jgi:hypothetical protein